MESSSFVARGLMSHLDEIGGVEPRVLNAYNLPGTSSHTIPLALLASLAVLGPLTWHLVLHHPPRSARPPNHYNCPLKFPSRIHYILCCI